MNNYCTLAQANSMHMESELCIIDIETGAITWKPAGTRIAKAKQGRLIRRNLRDVMKCKRNGAEPNLNWLILSIQAQ